MFLHRTKYVGFYLFLWNMFLRKASAQDFDREDFPYMILIVGVLLPALVIVGMMIGSVVYFYCTTCDKGTHRGVTKRNINMPVKGLYPTQSRYPASVDEALQERDAANSPEKKSRFKRFMKPNAKRNKRGNGPPHPEDDGIIIPP